METYYLGAYWRSRQESLDTCAQRMQRFLFCAKDCDPYFARWFRLGRSRSRALKHEISADLMSIRALLQGGAHRDIDGKDVEELGYHVALWNGAASDDDAVNISITCGGFSQSVRNACVISLPASGEGADRILKFSVLRTLIQCTVLAFEPNWCVVMSRSYRDSQATWSPDEPHAGWLLYISHQFGKLPTVDWPVHTDTIDGLGVLLVSTTERFSVSNPAHVRAAATIDQLLSMGGLLKR